MPNVRRWIDVSRDGHEYRLVVHVALGVAPVPFRLAGDVLGACSVRNRVTRQGAERQLCALDGPGKYRHVSDDFGGAATASPVRGRYSAWSPSNVGGQLRPREDRR